MVLQICRKSHSYPSSEIICLDCSNVVVLVFRIMTSLWRNIQGRNLKEGEKHCLEGHADGGRLEDVRLKRQASFLLYQ